MHADRMFRSKASKVVSRGDLDITRVSLHRHDGQEVTEVKSGDPLTVRVHFRANRLIKAPIFSLGLGDGRIGCFSLASMLVDGHVPTELSGEGHVDCAFQQLPLQPKVY